MALIAGFKISIGAVIIYLADSAIAHTIILSIKTFIRLEPEKIAVEDMCVRNGLEILIGSKMLNKYQSSSEQ